MTESSPTPISILSAVRVGNLEQVAEALERGDDVNAREKDGRTALMLAAANGHLPIIEMLLKMGAQPDLQDKNGRTALMQSSLKGHGQVTAVLLRGGSNTKLKQQRQEPTHGSYAFKGTFSRVQPSG